MGHPFVGLLPCLVANIEQAARGKVGGPEFGSGNRGGRSRRLERASLPGHSVPGHISHNNIPLPLLDMSDALDDSFHSSFTTNASSSSFRILSPASQLPRSRPMSSAENHSHAHGWVDYQQRPADPIQSSYPAPRPASVVSRARAPRPLPRVHKREVWRDILLKSDGRDKAFVRYQRMRRIYD